MCNYLSYNTLHVQFTYCQSTIQCSFLLYNAVFHHIPEDNLNAPCHLQKVANELMSTLGIDPRQLII
ncbi:hypothetical protein SUGI_0563820 [Cryptomeria japonica]|nr:hypothetical protein SUGI_0563820 [Cryptomeria japonica]